MSRDVAIEPFAPTYRLIMRAYAYSGPNYRRASFELDLERDSEEPPIEVKIAR